MESCTRTRIVLMSVVIIGIFSIEESEGFFLKNLLPEAQFNEEHIPLSAITQSTLISNKTHIVVDDIHRNVSEILEESSTQIVNSVKDIVHHTVNSLKTTTVPQEKSQFDVDLQNNEIPSSEDIVTLIEHQEPSDPNLSIVKLQEEDRQGDVVTVLEDNIRSSVKDEIQLVQNFESSAIDVIDDIPDAEVRQTLTEDLMAIEYPQSVKKLEEIESTSPTAASAKQDNASSFVFPVEITTVPTTVQTVAGALSTSEDPSETESTTTEPMLVEESTTFVTEVEDIHSLETLDDPHEIKQILTRQMRGFDEEAESDTSNHSSNSSSHSSGQSVNDLLQSESSTKDENVGAEETSEEIVEVISQDASVEGGFQKEDMTIQHTSFSRVPSTPRPYIAFTTETPITVTTEDTTNQHLIEPITEPTVDELNEVAGSNDGNHVVIKKPAVDDEFLLSDARDNEMLTNTNASLDDDHLTTTTEDMHVVNNTGEGILIDITAEKHILPNAEDDQMPSTHAEKVHMVHETEHDEDTVQNNSSSYTQSLPDEHNEPLLDGSQNIGVVDAPIDHALSPVSNSHPILLTLEHLDQDNIIDKIDAVKDEDEVLEIHTYTLPVNLDQQLADELPNNSQATVNNHGITNEIQFTEPISENNLETTTERPINRENENLNHEHLNDALNDSSGNAIFKEIDEVLPITTPVEEQDFEPVTFESSSGIPLTPSNEDRITEFETSTEKSSARSSEDETTPALVYTLIEAAELTTEFARHVDSFRAVRDETAAFSDEVISTAAAGRSFNAIVAEGLGKPLPTRSVNDEPSTSSYSSEDKTTTVVVLCSSAAIIFIAFSVAMYLITFQRQHGTLDIEMQEQKCGKDDLEEDEDAETRITLLNQLPQADSDAHSFE